MGHEQLGWGLRKRDANVTPLRQQHSQQQQHREQLGAGSVMARAFPNPTTPTAAEDP